MVQPARRPRLGSLILYVLAGAIWAVPLFGQLHKKFPYVGSLVLPIVVLCAVFVGLLVGLWFVTGEHRTTSRRSKIISLAGFAFVGVAGGILWAPAINAIGFGSARTVDGEIVVDEDAGRGNPNRRVVVVVDGKRLEGRFHAQNFWQSPVVRSGGPAKLEIRSGLFTPWVARFDAI